MLQVKDLTCREFALHGIDFSVRAGEVFGIAGRGRRRAHRTGARHCRRRPRTSQGQHGAGRQAASAAHARSEAIQAGVVLVPEDRKQQGVVVEHRIEDNLAYGNTDLLHKRGWVSQRRARIRPTRGVAAGRQRRAAVSGFPALSGGNQQKVIIAKWLARNPKVFILDEPTRGIDVGARAAIYEVIADLAATGMAVIVVSSDLEEVLGLSHRVMVMSRGRQMGILDRGEATPVSVMEMATG